MTHYKHWKLNTDSDLILWLTLDRKDRSVNSLNTEVMTELDAILETIDKQNLAGLIIRSGKASGFIAGADIEEISQLTLSPESAKGMLTQGQGIFQKLESLKIPTLAMIHGFCLGGGMELALACQYRIAEENPNTRLGLPEIKLGIYPGWGGSVRLPRLVGALKSMDIILTGRLIRAKMAARLGLIDFAVPERQLENAAKSLILKPRARRPLPFIDKLSNQALFKPFISRLLYNQLRKKKINPSHYPAPFSVIQHWANPGRDPFETEAEAVSKLMMSPTAKNLVRVFKLQNQLKEWAKASAFKLRHVHVIGAGTMGGDIAAWCALKGYSVTLQDREPKLIAPALKRAYALYKKQLKEGGLIQAAWDRLTPDPEGYGIRKADVIIEAIFENLEAKQQLFKTLETEAKVEAILATNTSSIPLDEINVVLKDPNRLVGIHFFNPVPVMQLVEIVKGEKTNEAIVKDAAKFVTSIGKLPIAVKSSPGFLVNRILLPYMLEAMAMLDEGIGGASIDKAAVQFGMPMGPIELGDTVGLDVCLSVAKNFSTAFGITVPSSLIKMVEAGTLGKKTGQGFYTYDKKGHKIRSKEKSISETSLSNLQTRMMARILNESAACLREKVVANEDWLDAGMIFGTGFAPFRGGPIEYAKTMGIDSVKHELNELSAKYGSRFTPDSGWDLLK